MGADHSNHHQRRSRPASFEGKPPHVLLIEDDDRMREMLAEALWREGWRVTECADALRWLQDCVNDAASRQSEARGSSDTYDVVVSDIRLPNMSGLDVLRILSDILCADACPPTIFITAFGDQETHEMARELGAVTVLDKPFAVKDLIERVRAVTGA